MSKLNKYEMTQPVYSPRTTYNQIIKADQALLSDLTLNFDPFTINVLKNEFYIRNWEMNLEEFILIVKEHLLSWQTDISNREVKLIRCLIMLFEEIDLNGNGMLEWEEFTNFIIEKALVINNMKTKQQQVNSYTHSNVTVKHKFLNLISKSTYVPEMDRIACFEEGTNKILFYNMENGQMNDSYLEVKPNPIKFQNTMIVKDQNNNIQLETQDQFINRKTMILDIYFIQDQKYQILLTSTNDGYVRGWNLANDCYKPAYHPDNENIIMEQDFKNEIYCMEWDSLNELLYCGEKNGQINVWDPKLQDYTVLDKEKEHNMHNKIKDKTNEGHHKVIMAMVAMPKLQFLASASLDSQLIIWDSINQNKKRVFREHRRGITSLAFHEQLILLFSAGFEHDFFVWNPYVDHLIHRVSGHISPLIGVIAIYNSTQIASCDIDGNIRVWDVKKFNCIQHYQIDNGDEKQNFYPQHITYMHKPLKLIISGKSLCIFEYDKNYNAKQVDNQPALCSLFDSNTLSVVTAHGNKVKIWNILDGDVKYIYSDVSQNEISVFILDFYYKRMIVGDTSGETKVFNVLNGAFLKSLPKHQAEVTCLYHVQQPHDIIITGSMDFKVHVCSDDQLNTSELLKTYTLQDQFATNLQYEWNLSFLIMGTNLGQIIFWEIDTGKTNGVYYPEHEETNTSICLIKDAAYVLISTSTGTVNLISYPPLSFKYQCVYQFQNKGNQGFSSGVIQIIVDQLKERMYLIDERQILKCFNIQSLLKKMQNSTKKGHLQVIPDFNDDDVKWMFSVKAHRENIISMELINLVMTTSQDKRVKIWDATTGHYVDSFQQNYDKNFLVPLGHRKIGTPYIYSHDGQFRIDLKASAMTEEELEEFYKKEQEKKDDILQKKQIQRTYEEEFNPFYFIDQVDQRKLTNLTSNSWNVRINFKIYDEIFTKKYQTTIGNVKDLQENYRQMFQHSDKKDKDNKNIEKKAPDHQESQEESVDQESTIQNSLEMSKKSIQQIVKVKANRQQQIQKSDQLSKQQLKSKFLEKSTQIKLSKEECNAAYKLASALSNYDEQDMRVLKFLDFKVQNQTSTKQNKKESKNFLEMNKNKIKETQDAINRIKFGKK